MKNLPFLRQDTYKLASKEQIFEACLGTHSDAFAYFTSDLTFNYPKLHDLSGNLG